MTWGMKSDKPSFQIDVRSLLNPEEQENFKGIFRFDYNPFNKKILVLLYK